MLFKQHSYDKSQLHGLFDNACTLERALNKHAKFPVYKVVHGPLSQYSKDLIQGTRFGVYK